MQLTHSRAIDSDQVTYVLTIEGGDLIRARLNRFDRLLLDDCNGPDATIADRLLGLETLARRIEEAT